MATPVDEAAGPLELKLVERPLDTLEPLGRQWYLTWIVERSQSCEADHGGG